MTFNFAPWAIDGARTSAGLARLAAYAGGGGRSGIIQPGDLRVTALAVPGNGLRISPGGAVVLNNYQTNPDESYVVSNPSTHTVLSVDMPAPIPSVGYYLVCVVVGDPEWDQTGHPFMPSTPLSAEAAVDYQYVRPVVIACNPNAYRAEDLNLSYPAVALARLEVPANTSTITNAMITDVRELSQPRSERHLAVRPMGDGSITSTDWTRWTASVLPLTIPRWATHVQIVASMNSISVAGSNAIAEVRVLFGDRAGVASTLDTTTGAFDDRVTIAAGLDTSIAHLAGQDMAVVLEARVLSPGTTTAINADHRSQIIFDVQFEERRV